MGKLDDKVAVITGGSSGIGLAAARRFRAEGARLALFARSEAQLAAAAEALGGDVLTFAGDVTENRDLERFFAAVAARHGGVDALFVNAGIAEWALAADVTTDHFDRLFACNVRGAFFTVQYALPHLRSGAAVVLNTSVANRVGAVRTSVYSATKAALRSLARTLSAELVGRGVRVNAVSPGPTETPILAKSSWGLEPQVLEEMGKDAMGRIALGRLGTADEIAAAAVFLASPESSFVVGQELAVDGGFSGL
jgi:NAD(P)-dependent dehydrogenase (short-subunit alcohol dehydrogenase family)